MPRAGRIHDAPAADARRHLGKAEEFLRAARLSLDEGHRIAATSLAVHAGIAAADAVTVARLGQRAAGPGHDQARALLDDAGPQGKEASRHLGRLLPLKTRSEYDPDDVPAAKAKQAVEWADRIVSIARRVVGPSRPR